MDLILEESSESFSHFLGCSFEIGDVDIITIGITRISDYEFLPVCDIIEKGWLSDDEIQGVGIGDTGGSDVNYE